MIQFLRDMVLLCLSYFGMSAAACVAVWYFFPEVPIEALVMAPFHIVAVVLALLAGFGLLIGLLFGWHVTSELARRKLVAQPQFAAAQEAWLKWCAAQLMSKGLAAEGRAISKHYLTVHLGASSAEVSKSELRCLERAFNDAFRRVFRREMGLRYSLFFEIACQTFELPALSNHERVKALPRATHVKSRGVAKLLSTKDLRCGGAHALVRNL